MKTVVGGLVCDMRNLRVCRANSDFDAKQIVISAWVYSLPFGHDGYVGKNMPGWADRIVGGWKVSGIWSWRTGFAFGTTTGAFPVGFNFNSLGVLTGSASAVASKIHKEGGKPQFFANATNAQTAFRNP